MIAVLPRSPMLRAQDTRLLRMNPLPAPASRIFSWIFSQTRGTPMNDVGRTSRSVVASEPCNIALLTAQR